MLCSLDIFALCLTHSSEPEGEEDEGAGLTLATPNLSELDELGKSTQESREVCVSLSQQIKAAMTEVGTLQLELCSMNSWSLTNLFYDSMDQCVCAVNKPSDKILIHSLCM